MRALVTGATGKVGHAVALALAERGHQVRALVRDLDAAEVVLPAEVELVKGDAIRPSTLGPAADGCELVVNAMGIPEQWTRDPDVFERVNARGTAGVVQAAVAGGVPRVVHVSTIDVFHAESGHAFDESHVATYPKGTAYERSKQHAERLALAAVEGSDTELVMVNPAGVYGPGPGGDGASLETGLLQPAIEGKRARLPFLPPGGMGLVHSPGLARGVLLAAERGAPGERYILCDGHMTLREIVATAVRLAGRGRVPLVLPAPVARPLARLGEGVAGLIGQPPLLPAGQLYFFLWNARPQSDKAQRELGWQPTPLEDGLRAAVDALG